MTEIVEPTHDEAKHLTSLLIENKIHELIAKHKPVGLTIDFNAERLKQHALAASYGRVQSAGPYFITLSPLLLDWGLTDRETFSTIILHELGHVVDRYQNWGKYVSVNPLNQPETREYEADDFVNSCGWKTELVKTLRLTIELVRSHGFGEGMLAKRLSRITSSSPVPANG